jgi:hypothetical protein
LIVAIGAVSGGEMRKRLCPRRSSAVMVRTSLLCLKML